MDYYEILGLTKNATPEDIKKAYHRLAREYHPDLHAKDEKAQILMQQINEAYGVLSNPQKKAVYDAGGMGGASNMDDAWSDFFGDAAGSGSFVDNYLNYMHNRDKKESKIESTVVTKKGDDITIDIDVSLAKVVSGGQQQLSYFRKILCPDCLGKQAAPDIDAPVCPICKGTGKASNAFLSWGGKAESDTPCDACNGYGRMIKKFCPTCAGKGFFRKKVSKLVNLPAGVRDGMKFRLAKCGDDGIAGGEAGDLIFITKVTLPEEYTLEQDTLVLHKKVSVWDAMLGGTIAVQTPTDVVRLNYPGCSGNGARLTIKGQGLPTVKSAIRKDLCVILDIEMPTSLTARQRNLISQLRELDLKQ